MSAWKILFRIRSDRMKWKGKITDVKFKYSWMILLVVFGLFKMLLVGCSPGVEESHSSHSVMEAKVADSLLSLEEGQAAIQVPEEFHQGEERFNVLCSRCHGVYARGTGNGPPLVHKIYEPSHHGDFAFQRAAAQGVRAHHWEFGNMPKIVDASPDDVTLIIQYVRWLQRKAGIH